MASKPPIDPITGAWWLMLALIATVALNTVFLFVGCAILGVAAMCERTGNNLRDVTLELLAAIAILVTQRR
jgi:hypothetical protein